MEEALRNTAQGFVGFAAIDMALPSLLSGLKGYTSASGEARVRQRQYVHSLIHASVVTGFSAWQLFRLWQSGELMEDKKVEGSNGATKTKRVNTFMRNRWRLIGMMCGYFLHDMWMMRRVFAEFPIEIYHHLLGITVTAGVPIMCKDNALMRFVPHLCMVELSTIFLDISWLLRTWFPKAPKNGAILRAARANTLLFAASFMALRVIYFPAMLVWFKKNKYAEPSNGWRDMPKVVKYTLVLAAGLQQYWGVGIIKKML